MANDKVEVDVTAAADAVWEIIGDFDACDKLFPAIEKVTIEDTEAGHDRIISMFGMDIRERLISKDNTARVLIYTVVDLPNHLGTITVADNGDSSHVTWEFQVDSDDLLEMLRGTYAQGLEALVSRFA
ncbi:MAG: SRPBCC family protein [Actinomycetes bacterium]